MGNVRTATQNDLQWGNHIPDDLARLDQLLSANAEIAKRRSIFRTDREELDALTMKRPISAQRAFAYLGLMLGTLGPFSIFLSIVLNANFEPGLLVFLFLFLVANSFTATVGCLSGRTVGRAVMSFRDRSWPSYIALSALLGILWGGFSGAVGGMFLFVIGGFFGSIIGAMAGGLVLPVFAIAHRLLASGDLIETKHFLPIAFGSVLTLCAFIFGIS